MFILGNKTGKKEDGAKALLFLFCLRGYNSKSKLR